MTGAGARTAGMAAVSPRTVRILGVDPGTAVTGYGVVMYDGRTPTLIECGVIRTIAKDSLAARLQTIHAGITELITHHQPNTIAVEDVFYARNVRTTVVLGHARGVILLAGQQAGLTICEYPPAVIKKAITGTGAATKEQVQFMVAKLLRLKSAPQPADAADGVAAALCACLTPQFLPAPTAAPRLPISKRAR